MSVLMIGDKLGIVYLGGCKVQLENFLGRKSGRISCKERDEFQIHGTPLSNCQLYSLH